VGFCGIITLFTHTVFAQTWQTVDDLPAAEARGLAVAPNGTLFASGFVAASDGHYHGLVMASTDTGITWSGALDDYVYGPGYETLYDGGMVTNPVGNLYVAGEAYGVEAANHWIIRRSTDNGATWSLVDDFAPGSSETQPFGLATDSAGNVYVAGVANHPGVNDLVWTVRKGVGGASFTTVDTLSSGQANGIYSHPTAGIFAVGSAYIPGTRGYKYTEAWIVRRSLNGGATWSTVDSFQLSQNLNSRAFGVGADTSGNLYVVGQGFVSSGKSGKNAYSHWIVRKSANGGSSWSTVDDFQLSPTGNSGAGRFIADSNGNLYVAGGTPFNQWFANEWIVRKNPGGTGTWQTVDDFQYVSGGAALPFAMAANASGNVFVGGVGSSSSGEHWLVRKK